MNVFDRAKTWYNKLGTPELPTMPDGSELSSLQISADPPHYVYGDPIVLAWLAGELTRRESQGMPEDPLDRMPRWR